MNRRQIIQTAALGSYAVASAPAVRDQPKPARKHLTSVTAKDGTNLFVQDWGSGRPVVFVAAWAFNSNVWGSHIAALTGQGFAAWRRIGVAMAVRIFLEPATTSTRWPAIWKP